MAASNLSTKSYLQQMEIKSEMEPAVVFGPIYAFIQDPEVEEIWINSPERTFIAKHGRSSLTTLIMTSLEVRDLVERALLWSGRRLDLSNPFVDARLPDGSRLHVVIPEITAEYWSINIRKHTAQKRSLETLAKGALLSDEIAKFLKYAVEAGLNLLISGGTQAGKTTLLNALASEIPARERVITIEEVFEIKPRVPDLIQMQTRGPNLQGEGEISLRRLIKESLRMRPNRLIIGEVREAEALDLLIALNSGIPGMGTIHANSARDALFKLETLPLLAGENISHAFIVPTVAAAVDLVIQVRIDSQGFRRVTEIIFVTGRSEFSRIEVEDVWKWEGDTYERGAGYFSTLRKISELRGESALETISSDSEMIDMARVGK
jgi:pilus assembly protein CpaF